jgi:hypothetical protein
MAAAGQTLQLSLVGIQASAKRFGIAKEETEEGARPTSAHEEEEGDPGGAQPPSLAWVDTTLPLDVRAALLSKKFGHSYRCVCERCEFERRDQSREASRAALTVPSEGLYLPPLMHAG